MSKPLKVFMVFNKELRNSYVQYGQSLAVLKNMSIDTTANIDGLGKAVSNLAPKQQVLALATRGLNQEQIKQVMLNNEITEEEIQQALADTALITQKKQLTKEYALEAITAQGLSEAKAREIMTSAGIVAGDNAEVISKKQVNVATLQAKLAQEGLSAAQIKTITTQLGLGKSTLTLSNYFKGLGASVSSSAKAFGKFLISSPMGWATIAVTAITGITTAISKYNEKQQEAIESAKQSAQETSEYIDSLDGLKEKYLEIVDSESSMSEKTQELNEFKQELIETYGFEKDIIDKLNLSREYGIELLDEETKKQLQKKKNEFYAQNKNVIDDAIDTIENTQTVEVKTSLVRPNELSKDILDKFSSFNANTGFWGDYWTFDIDAKNIYDEYDKINELIVDLQNRKDLNSSEQNFLNALINTSEGIKEEIEKYKDVYGEYIYYEADTLLNDYISKYGDAANLTGRELENWKNGLYETANGNAVLEESLASLVDQIYQFNDAEIELSLSGTGISNNLSESLQTALSEYEDKISDFLSEKEKIDSALKEQEENGSISASTAFELSQTGYQSALKYDSETKAYKLLREEINKTAESRRAETKAKLESEKASAIKSIQDEAERIKESTVGTKEYYSMYVSKLDDYKSAIQEVSDAYDFYISMLEDSDDATSDFSDTISKLNDKLEKCKESVQSLSSIQSTVKSATEEQNAFGRLSADTINALHEAGLDGATAYNEMTGETYLLVDAIDELTRAKIDNQKADIEQGIIDTTNAITKAQEDLNNLGVIDSPDDAAKALELNRYIAELEKTRADLQFQKQITTSYKYSFEADSEDIEESAEDAVEEYINSIKEAFDKEKSDLDHLLNMDVISQEEYYNRLFDLNEKYFKGKTELLDEYRQYEEEVYKGLKETQIKALQKQIDALKSVNEEKQEEIDLEKAKQALENAKRNKTISVYDSERGWIRETDRNAIDSAQKEYDDLVLNEKVETLEKLIDAIENGTNTSHQLDESVNAFEQVNSITGQQFIENVMQSFANKGLDFGSMFNTNGLTNGADVYNSIMQGKITPVSSSNSVVNNSSITLNGVTVMANNPEEFIAQMEDIADERFKENFPSAMNQFGRDLQRYKMNHSL